MQTIVQKAYDLSGSWIGSLIYYLLLTRYLRWTDSLTLQEFKLRPIFGIVVLIAVNCGVALLTELTASGLGYGSILPNNSDFSAMATAW